MDIRMDGSTLLSNREMKSSAQKNLASPGAYSIKIYRSIYQILNRPQNSSANIDAFKVQQVVVVVKWSACSP